MNEFILTFSDEKYGSPDLIYGIDTVQILYGSVKLDEFICGG